MTLAFGHTAETHLDESTWLCRRCETLNRLADVKEEDKEAIRTAARSGHLAGVKEARNRLGWPLNESVDAVYALCDQIDAAHVEPEWLQAKQREISRFIDEQYAKQQAGRNPP